MKITKKILLTVLMFLYGVLDMFCKTDDPPPPPAPPPPPGLPIDENIYMLLIVALFLGIYIIYNNKLKTKTPT